MAEALFAAPGCRAFAIAEGDLPALQRFFAPAHYRRAWNEVDLATRAGVLLRIDRLVHLREAGPGGASQRASGGVWWVLDYKLSEAPQELELHRLQLQRYQRAVSRLQPQAIVKAAFITGRGAVVELD